MTTKKQKREIAEKKRADFEAKLKADGLEAQQRDRERSKIEEARWVEAGRKENKRLESILAMAMVHKADQSFEDDYAMYEESILNLNDGKTIPLVNYKTKEVEGSAELKKMGDDIIAEIRVETNSPLNEAIRMSHERLMHAAFFSRRNDFLPKEDES